MPCSCGENSNLPSNTTQDVSSALETESNVSKKHIDFILNREVFMSGMETFYKKIATDYDKQFDTSMTFGHLINENYFDNMKWEYFSNEDDMIIVTFCGTTDELYNRIPVSASFAWTSTAKAPIISRCVFGKDANGNYNEYSANEIQEKYGYDDYSTALFACDATFSVMLVTALVYTSNNNTQEQTEPSTSENTKSNTPSVPNNTQSTEQPTAPTVTAADYYKQGKDYYSSEQYLKAAEQFQKAGNYSDANTMLLDCYYQYGKNQMALQYTSEATKYLSMCRGYKDADEILLSFYYSEAISAYNALIQDFNTYGDHGSAYQDAKQKLLLCEGYKDSATMMRVAESIYNACENMDSLSGYEASLDGMTISANGNNVSITKEDFMGSRVGELLLNTNIAQKTFSATISHIFAPNMRNYGEVKVIEALILLFTDINSTSDLSSKIQNENDWTISGTTENFSSVYGGYNISIRVTEADWGYVDCTIKVEK